MSSAPGWIIWSRLEVPPGGEDSGNRGIAKGVVVDTEAVAGGDSIADDDAKLLRAADGGRGRALDIVSS
jgi:hypothetical protein